MIHLQDSKDVKGRILTMRDMLIIHGAQPIIGKLKHCPVSLWEYILPMEPAS